MKDEEKPNQRREIGTRLNRARERSALSRAKAAEAIGINRQALWAIEEGHRNVSSDELAAFSDLYGVSVTWLMDRPSRRATDDRAEIAAQMLANLSDEAIDRLFQAIVIVKERRPRSMNLPRW
jgi:transcriptional regulator with XRE-family HTH domain